MYNAIDHLDKLYDLMKKVETKSSQSYLEYDMGIERAIELFTMQTKLGRKIIFIGNGGSAAIAEHSAIDYWKNGGIRAISFNDGPLLTCIGNDYGYEMVFEKPLRMFADADDVLVAISSSGKSPNILNAAKAAIEMGCNVITLSGFSSDNPLRELGDMNFYLPSDHYGLVELGHQIILHTILDLILVRSNG
ncbi:MAG: SIS domain-containing protein [Acidobacteriota bacterium]